ncbi:hypothetical protein ACHWQZ_G005333 [Mnemiopsis leidyi]
MPPGDSIGESTVSGYRVGMRQILPIWILFFINLFNYIDRYIVSGTLDQLLDDFDLTFSQGGLLTTIFIVSYMILSPVFGFLGDRYNRSYLIAVGLIIWASSTFLCSYASTYWQLLVLRGVVGIGEASYAALAPPIIADLIPAAQRTFYLSFFFIGTPVGGALGFIIGGGISERWGWRWAFRVSPPVVTLLAIATLFLVPNPERGGADNANASVQLTHSQEIRAGQNPIVQLAVETWSLLKTKSYLYTTLGFSCLAFTVGSLTQWIPVYVVHASEMAGTPYSNTDANLIFGILTCVAGFVAIPLGSVLSKFLERYTMKADALINAVGMLVTSVTLYIAIAMAPYNISVFWVFAMITQIAAFIGWAPNTAIILYTTPALMRSLAQAVNILFSHLLGDAISPTIQGELSDRIKEAFKDFDFSISTAVALEYSFFLSSFVCVLGSVLYFMAAENLIEDRAKAADTVVSRRPTMANRSRENSALNASGYLRDEYGSDQEVTRPLI